MRSVNITKPTRQSGASCRSTERL